MKNLRGTDWGRDKLVEKYSSYDLPYIIVTADVDVSKLYRFSKENDLSFYTAMIYCVMDTVNSIKNFHYRIKEDGQPVFCDKLTASFTYLPSGWEQFYVVNIPFEKGIVDFCKKAKNQAEAMAQDTDLEVMHSGDNLGIIYMSVLPWIKYSQFVRTIEHGGKDNIPRISWGKFEKCESGKMMMPLSVQVHHALMDGLHVGMFYDKLQQLLNAIYEK